MDHLVGRARQRLSILLSCLVSALLLTGAFHRPLLTAAAEALIVDDLPISSDLIFLLNGDARRGVRASLTAELYHRGISSRIALVQVASTDDFAAHGVWDQTLVNLSTLHRNKIPDSAIVVLPYPGGANDTRDEARALRAYVQQYRPVRITAVTSEVHTGRALLILRQELAGLATDIRIAASPDPYRADNWWTMRVGRNAYLLAYLKYAYALLE